jgi:hypothetical protein
MASYPVEDVPRALATDSAAESDKRLLELGYKPEFRREMSLFGVLGISFCAIGILTGMSSAFQTGLFSGGPVGQCTFPPRKSNSQPAGLFWGWNVRTRIRKVFWWTQTGEDCQYLYAAHRPVVGGNLQRLSYDGWSILLGLQNEA